MNRTLPPSKSSLCFCSLHTQSLTNVLRSFIKNQLQLEAEAREVLPYVREDHTHSTCTIPAASEMASSARKLLRKILICFIEYH